MKLGAIDFLQKPLRPEDLRNAVAEMKNCQKDDRSSESFEAHLAAAKRCLNLHAFALARLHLATALKLNAKSVEAFNLAGVLAEVLEGLPRRKKSTTDRRSGSTKPMNLPKGIQDMSTGKLRNWRAIIKPRRLAKRPRTK
jgi:hypothetical protein